MANDKRGAELNTAIEDMIAKIAETGQSQQFKDWMQFLADGNYLSFGNFMWCFVQNPHITNVRSMKKWNKVGRKVSKGQKGLQVLFPKQIPVRFDANDRIIRYGDNGTPVARVGSYLSFGVGYVFDVSQTEGAELPVMQWYSTVEDGTLFAKLDAMCKARGIIVSIEDTGVARGYSAGGKIGLLTEGVKTFIHEIAHEILHKPQERREMPRKQKELEAEMVAYIVCQRMGIDVADTSSVYLANWGATVQAIRQSTSRIEQAVREILDEIEGVESAD